MRALSLLKQAPVWVEVGQPLKSIPFHAAVPSAALMTVWFLDCWLTPSWSNASERSLLFFQTDLQRMFSAEPLSSVPWGDGLFVSWIFPFWKVGCFRDIQLCSCLGWRTHHGKKTQENFGELQICRLDSICPVSLLKGVHPLRMLRWRCDD